MLNTREKEKPCYFLSMASPRSWRFQVTGEGGGGGGFEGFCWVLNFRYLDFWGVGKFGVLGETACPSRGTDKEWYHAREK